MMNNEPGNETPQISVVIPALNEQGNIGHLIDEIHDALAENLCYEVLVDDDASTDGTRDEVEDAAARYGGVRLVRHGQTPGLSAAVRRGIAAATANVNAVLGGDG